MSRAIFPQSDYEKNRIWGGLGYLVFFLPLIFCPNSRYGKHCANQGLIGLIAILLIALAGWILGLILGWIPLVGALISWVMRLARIAVSLLCAYYCYLAIAKNDTRTFPYIGETTLIR